ncbi:MAG TPA: PHP domain-containing protein, partial [Acidimicrobiales bacterium]|nr:PHP domain-containing protein [Acidimicrobiales bacterium]
MLDYHLHLWPHGESGRPLHVDELHAYCEQAATMGVTEIALTEHLFRFTQADELLSGWWESDPDPKLRSHMAEYWSSHVSADLDDYVEKVLAAKAEGLPVLLGLEVDFYEGRMDVVADLLEGYPFDVLLGSVHWIGAWGFDVLGEPVVMNEWEQRDIDEVWHRYTLALEELAASGVCDVLAHPDLPKVSGRRPSTPDEFYARMTEAAATSGMAAEVSTAGWRKPVGEAYPAPPLLARFNQAGVPVTTASDAHSLPVVADRMGDTRALLAAAGYDTLSAFSGRTRRQVP